MLVVFPLFLLFGFVALFVLLGPMLVDFLRRDDRVGWWFALPFLLVAPMVGFGLAVPLFQEDPRQSILLTTMAWCLAHLMVAGIFLVQGLGLAASRGLRPNGRTLRRRRTSLAAIALCVSLLFVPWFPGRIDFIWILPVGLSAVLWVVAMNRRGPSRLERGKAVSGAMFVGAAIQFCFALVHLSLTANVDEPVLFESLAEMWVPLGLILCGMVAGLRFLAGSIAPHLPFVSLFSGLSLVFPMWLDFPTLPDSTLLPEWVDLAGDPGPPLRVVSTLDCVWHGGPSRHCGAKYYGIVGGNTPLSDVPSGVQFIVRHRGIRVVGDSWRYKVPLRVLERDGSVVIAAQESYGSEERPEEVLSFGELHARLQQESDRPLFVAPTPNWTVQQFVSMCASMGVGAECRLERDRIPR